MDNTGYEIPFVAETYDFVVPHRTRADVNFFIEAAKESGGPVLELGCGTGRVLLPTARAGIEITGIDASEPMLGICRSRLQKESAEVESRVHLVKGQMQNFGLAKKFHLVTMPFRPFQLLLSIEDQISCLRCVHLHLIDSGKVILDLYNPWIHLLIADTGNEFGEEPAFTMSDGTSIVRKHRTVARDLFNQISDEEMIHYVTRPDGSTERIVEPLRMRYLFRFEAEHLLARCGFELEHVYADFKKTPYGEKYPGELIMVAKRV